ncbi:MAG: hypothetical protein U5K53_10615 [Halanaerobiales bacterium]|nr:hypothetical protein [Halanaerobiales bacterium]
MDENYIKVNEGNKKLTAEKIFQNKKPRSRVILSTVKDIENVLEKYKIDNDNFLNFISVKKIEGEYYIISDKKEYMPTLLEKIKEDNYDIEQAVNWVKKALKIWDNFEYKEEFNAELKLNYFRINNNNEVKIVNPFVNKVIESYRYKPIKNEHDEIYRSPDVINSGDYNTVGRIYNFGVILYYLTTNKLPFQGDNKTEMFDKKMTNSFDEPRFLNPDISKSLSDLIIAMLNNGFKNKDLKDLINGLDEITNNNIIKASEKEIKENKKLSKGKLKKNKRKQSIIFFFRHHWGKTLLVIAVIAMFVGLGFMGGTTPVVTEETSPEEVVNFFYDSIDKKDPVVIDQTTVVDLNKLENMVTEGHVMETMRNAYSSLSEEEKEENKIYGIKTLSIEQFEQNDYFEFKTSYIFYYPGEEQMEESTMNDTLIVEKIDGLWQITEINGDIRALIEGNFYKDR